MKKWCLWAVLLLLATVNSAVAEIEWPEALNVIEESAFENDASIMGVVTLPDNVEQVQQNAFSGTNVYAMNVSASVATMEAQHFNHAAYIRVEGADTLVNGLSGMQYLIVPDESSAEAWAVEQQVEFVRDSHVVETDGFYYAKQENDTLKLLSARDASEIAGSIEIPEEIDGLPVKAISEYAFIGCGALTEIKLPGSVKASYRSSAVEDCPNADVQFYGAGANYPAVIPGVDFGGASVWIADYWSGGSGRNPDPTQAQADLYAYQDWIEETYNVHVYEQQDGDWATCAEAMRSFTNSPDGSLRLYIIEPNKVGNLIRDGIAAPLSGRYVDLYADKWNSAERQFMTIGGQIYGCYAGCSEPRQCLYFNKRVLIEAGIDWNSIYDMQANGTWTWSALTSMLDTVTRDTDNDGTVDVWGIVGSQDDFYLCSVFSNGGSFFDFDASGELYPAMGSSQAIAGMNWAKDVIAQYWMKKPEGGSWNWYQQAWKNGQTAFYMYQTYGGFNDNSEMADMEDKWGCVAFPTAAAGGNYINIVSDNITMIPSCYDADTVAKLMLIYDLWTNPAPGYSNDGAWIGNKYQYTDRRAVNETYGMLRRPEHCVVNKTMYLGSQNDVLGGSLLWGLNSSNPAGLVEAGMPAWQALCDSFNASRR